jgi:hypothetical protein
MELVGENVKKVRRQKQETTQILLSCAPISNELRAVLTYFS